MAFWKARPGVNLIEVLVAAVIAGIVMLALGNFIGASLRVTNSDRDRAFAMQKALQMMEELAAYNQSAHDAILDDHADGMQFVLTTAPDVLPDQPLSGNPKVAGRLKYVRDILVEGVKGDDYARKVTVRVWYAEPSLQAGGTPQAGAKGDPLAVVSNVLRSTVAKPGPVHVLDVYALSIENMPHVVRKGDDDVYYPSASEARRNFMAALNGIKSKNPWLEFNVHYITRLSVGRDPLYRPYVNEGLAIHKDPDSSKRDPLDWVYLYPGQIDQGPELNYYYNPGDIEGKILLGDATGGATALDNGGYALADQFNHAVRYPREFDSSGRPLKPDGVSVASAPEDMSLRQFLEALLSDTSGKYRNALLVNLHGELFPSLPLRNYADAAKDPAAPGAAEKKRRLVLHPYRLNVPSTEAVRLLAYPYMEDGSDTPWPASTATDNTRFIKVNDSYASRAKITIKGIKPHLKQLTGTSLGVDANDVKITVVQRERPNSGNSDTKYVRVWEWPNSLSGSNADEMTGRSNGGHSGPHATWHDNNGHHGFAHADIPPDPAFASNDFVIHVSDLDYDARRTTQSSDIYGIKVNSGSPDRDYMLHGLQYFPDPYLPFLDRPSADHYPRNTARIIIEFGIDATGFPNGKRFEVVTQLMKSDGSWADPDDPAQRDDPTISRTWYYVGAGSLASDKLYRNTLDNSLTIPWTEQVQLVGDPRHNPYLDYRKKELYNPYFGNYRSNQEVYRNIFNDGSSTGSKHLDAFNPLLTLQVPDQPPPNTNSLPATYDIKFPDTSSAWATIKYNAPAYFRMWREALLRHSMVFANLTGEPIRFLGLGGEFALEKKVNGIGDLKAASKPWDGGTGDAGDKSNELFKERAPWIERQSDDWYAKPWLGEIYTSDQWSNWSGKGNLPTGTFRRERIGDLPAYRDWPSDARSDTYNTKQIKNDFGLPSFLNAENVVNSSGPLDMDPGDNKKGTLTATGKKIADGLRLRLLGQPKSDYAYKRATSDTAAQPPEWNLAPYLGLRATLDWLNPDPPVNPRGYYTSALGSGYFASNPIMISDNSGTDPRRAFVAATTFRPENATQVASLLDAGVAAMVGTYLDGTRNGIGKFNVKPLPRVKLTEPSDGAGLAGTLNLTWYARWTRSDGEEYSPFYTYDPSATVTSGGPLEIVHFVKVKQQPAGSWQLAGTWTSTAPGAPGPAAEAIANQPYPNPINASFNIGSLANGEYLVRVEAYRKDGTAILPGNYAYHQIAITVSN